MHASVLVVCILIAVCVVHNCIYKGLIRRTYYTLAGIGSATCIGCDGKMFRVSAKHAINNVFVNADI